MHLFSVTSVYVAIYCPKTRFLGLHFVAYGRLYGSIINYFDVIGLKATEFGRITQNNNHYALPFKVTNFGTNRKPIIM